MKAARLVVLTVAIAAGGVAAMLAGRSEKPPEVKTAPAPRSPPSTSWSPNPTSPWARRFRRATCSGRTGRPARRPAISSARPISPTPSKIGRLDRPRALRRRRADPRSQTGQRQGLRLHGRDPADRHARHLHADFAGDRRRRLHPAERPCRRHSDAPRPRRREGDAAATRAHQRDHPHQYPRAGDRPERARRKNGQKVVVGKTATLELYAEADRNAGAVAAARHAVAGAAQHHRCVA